MPQTNAKGWYQWALIDRKTKEVIRVQYKSETEVDEDNKTLTKNGNQNFIWILNDGK